MMRVPGSSSSLAQERTGGADVRVVYSPLDAVKLARSHPEKQVVFLGVGFETTTPTVAVAVKEALGKVDNFSLLSAHKLVPPALEALGGRPDFSVDGLILPGHVSTVIGSDAYRPVARQQGISCVVAGFEPVDVLLAVLMLLRQIRSGRARVEVEYRMAVRPDGNPQALRAVQAIFQPEDCEWRGLGFVPDSGLRLRPEFAQADAALRFEVSVEPPEEHRGCLCGQVLVGAVVPPQCPLFGDACTPSRPVGACMVSSEGTCAAYYKYEV
jgi:hydrogenase expression/formation protein HypD